MTCTSQQQKKYQAERKVKLARTKELLARECKHNALLQRWSELDDYYLEWIQHGTLVAVLPARGSEDPASQSYYCVESNKHDTQELGLISPVWMYVNGDFVDETIKYDHTAKRYFLLDSEHSKLYKYENKPHSQESHFVKTPKFEEYKAYLEAHPVALFFYGCDDGHVGLRFKTEKEAMEYLQCMDVFEDVFEDKNLQYHN